ncbi:MAG: hypothetical protein AUH72_15165 [Acidobacteria bacterium 13_1_40CM_4_65_8]|nr:MAG: hypothetical protein AUH72_15165 [Acidobacteria bacterium 13_1_40CM_4_65_8]
MLDAQHLLDIRAPVHARAARGLRHAELRKLRFPRAQHVRLHLDEIADLHRLEQRAIGDLDLSGDLRHKR